MPSLNDKVLKIINENKVLTEEPVKPEYTDLGPAVVSPTSTVKTDYTKGVPSQALRSGASQKDHAEVSDISDAQCDHDGHTNPEDLNKTNGDGPELKKGDKVVAEGDIVSRTKSYLKRFNENFIKDEKPEDKKKDEKDKDKEKDGLKEDLGADAENKRQFDKEKDAEPMHHVTGQPSAKNEETIDEKLKGLPRIKTGSKPTRKEVGSSGAPVAITHQKEETDKEDPEDKDKDKKDMAEDINALFSGESLTEDFKKKATLIFETAVNMRVNSIVERKQVELETELNEQLDEAINQVTEVLSEKVDRYLNYVAEEWVKENAVNIENTLRANIAEDFMKGLKTLFEQHNIEVPRSKVDMLASMVQRNDTLEEQVNSLIESNSQLMAENIAFQKSEILQEISEGLTVTQIEKLKTLSETVEFKNSDTYKQNLTILRESNFSNSTPKAKNLTEDTNKTPINGVETKNTDSITQDILNASARLNKK